MALRNGLAGATERPDYLRPVGSGAVGDDRDYARISNAIVDDETLTIYEKAVYLVIRRHDWGEGYAMSTAYIAQKARCCVSKVQDALRGLEQRGLITSEPRRGLPTIYHAHWPPTPVLHTAPTPVRDTEEVGTTYRGTPVPHTAKRRHTKKTPTGKTPHGVCADAPPATAQNETPEPSRERPESKSPPWIVAAACLQAQGAPFTDADVAALLKMAKQHIVDRYQGQATPADVKACVAYLRTDPWVQEHPTAITPKYVGKRLDPWLKAGKPTTYQDSRAEAPPASSPDGIMRDAEGRPVWLPERTSVVDHAWPRQRDAFVAFWGNRPEFLTAEQRQAAHIPDSVPWKPHLVEAVNAARARGL